MGGVLCTGGTSKRNANIEREQTRGFSGKLKSIKSFNKKKKENSSLNSDPNSIKIHDRRGTLMHFSGELRRSAPMKVLSSKVPQRSSFLGRAGMVGLEKAVDVLDTLGSSVSSLNSGSGFISGMASRGNKVSILAFEVANTITKGASLLLSLSEENLKSFKKEILHSKGVKELVSTDMKELLSIAAVDKREELNVFSREVIRFGNLCKDPQWHNLNRYFSKLESDSSRSEQLRNDVTMRMQELVALAQYTSELYHEYHALDRFEQDYRRKIEELEALNLPRKGEGFAILQSELKQQRKLVRNLQKESLWSRTLEEIMENFVDVVTYMQQAITDAFGDSGSRTLEKAGGRPGRLGEAGLALHYANIVQQIDSIASRPLSLPPTIRDTLYRALPESVKKSLYSRLRSLNAKEELSMSDMKAEMEKTLHWLVPLATSTTKAHQGFGWVGEWANNGIESIKSISKNISAVRLQTLYHADKQKMDKIILELLIWLHRLINAAKQGDNGLRHAGVKSPMQNRPEFHSTTQLSLSPDYSMNKKTTELSLEDRFLLERASKRRLVPRVSKSQEFCKKKRVGMKIWTLSRSAGRSPSRGFRDREVSEHRSADFLDVLDGLKFAL